MNNRYEYEQQGYDLGYKFIAGCDEAGRGPMAGPLVVAAVMFPKDFYFDEINDSKQLSEAKRERLYDIIMNNALCYSIKIYDHDYVDKYNVYQTSRQGMIDCVNELDIMPDYILTDAMPLGNQMNYKDIIKGDALSISIGAASILAKVTRDRIMKEYANKYPEYGFDKHKGYPTKEHISKIQEYGICKIHRKTFKPVMEVLNKQMTFQLD